MTMLELLEAENVTLHDAVLLSETVDYAQKLLMLELDIWLGGTSELKEEWEAYQRATLRITGLRYFVQETWMYPRLFDRPSTIDGFVTRDQDIEQSELVEVPLGTFRHSLYIFDGNCFIRFAGTGAVLIRTGAITEGPSSWSLPDDPQPAYARLR